LWVGITRLRLRNKRSQVPKNRQSLPDGLASPKLREGTAGRFDYQCFSSILEMAKKSKISAISGVPRSQGYRVKDG